MCDLKNFGEFEILVLVVLLYVGDNVYGVCVWFEIEIWVNCVVLVGVFYLILFWFENKGYVIFSLGEVIVVCGGCVKCFY